MRCPTRRSFLGAAAAIPLASSAQTSQAFRKRVHPLEGIASENLKIRDVKVTVMSYHLPPDRQWITGRAVTWKTDLILIEIQTDKGIVGIGESSPYAGPDSVKKTIEELARPTLIGQNPFDVEYLTTAWGGHARTTRSGPVSMPHAGTSSAKPRASPSFKLLAGDGAPQPHIRMYASGGVEYAWYDRPDALSRKPCGAKRPATPPSNSASVRSGRTAA